MMVNMNWEVLCFGANKANDSAKENKCMKGKPSYIAYICPPNTFIYMYIRMGYFIYSINNII